MFAFAYHCFAHVCLLITNIPSSLPQFGIFPMSVFQSPFLSLSLSLNRNCRRILNLLHKEGRRKRKIGSTSSFQPWNNDFNGEWSGRFFVFLSSFFELLQCHKISRQKSLPNPLSFSLFLHPHSYNSKSCCHTKIIPQSKMASFLGASSVCTHLSEKKFSFILA